jgi:hypothetical protein
VMLAPVLGEIHSGIAEVDHFRFDVNWGTNWFPTKCHGADSPEALFPRCTNPPGELSHTG